MDLDPARASEPESWAEYISYTGNATGAPAKLFGKGVTVARTGVGVWLITFTDPPGNLLSYNCELQGTVPSSLAGFTTVLGAFTPASGATKASVSVSFFSSTFAAVDLTAAQTANLILWFKRAQASL